MTGKGERDIINYSLNQIEFVNPVVRRGKINGFLGGENV